MHIPDYLERSARYFADRPAVIHGQETLNHAALFRRACRLANALRGMGLRQGDRVAIQAWNSPRVVEFECALYLAGLVRVPINARQTPAETLELLVDADARGMVAEAGHAQALTGTGADLSGLSVRLCFGGASPGWADYEAALERASDARPDVFIGDDDLAVLHYSSGSTGKLKAAMHSFRNRRAGLRNVIMGSPGAYGPGNTILMMGPLTHATGVLMQPMLSRGMCLRVYDKFDLDRMFDDANHHRFTHVFMVPTMLNMMMAHPDVHKVDFSGLKQLTYGAAPTTPDRIREVWERVGPVLTQGYGASEVCGGVAALSPEDHQRALSSTPGLLSACGRAMTEMDVAVCGEDGRELPAGEVGEIMIRGESVAQGYWKAPEQTAEAFLPGGWYRTGDLARRDDEGYLYIVGRSKDMIISGGFNVYTAEVEAAVQRHPAVHEVCVFGVPDAVWGEAVHACVTLRPGHQLSEADILAGLPRDLAAYKKPRSLAILPQLPRNHNGKIDRKQLREPHWSGRATEVI